MATAQETQNARDTAAFLASHGLTQAQIAGIMGNIQVESTFNPGDNTGDGGLAHGLLSWHPDRRPPGGLPTDLQGQLNWFWTEAHSSESKNFQKFLANSATPAAAAASFDQYYERSDGSARATRIKDANAWQTALSTGVVTLPPNTSAGTGTDTSSLSSIPGVKQVGGLINDTIGWTEKLGNLISWITDVHNLERVGYFLIGSVLVVVGAAKMFGGTTGGAISAAAKVIK